MTDTPALDKRKNKTFVINNRLRLKQYALKNYGIWGQGIIVVNLLLLNRENIDELNLSDDDLAEAQETTIHQPISYIPKPNFWFKMISLKIKKKYQIDIQAENQARNKFLIVFIKDVAIENFSIYSLRLENSGVTE